MEHMGLKEPIGSRKPQKTHPFFFRFRKVSEVNFTDLDLDEGDLGGTLVTVNKCCTIFQLLFFHGHVSFRDVGFLNQ